MPDMKLDGDDSTLLGKPEKPEYPHGLRLHLEDEQIKKLGMGSMPEVGSVLEISGKAEVVMVANHDGKRSVGLQITEFYTGAKAKTEETVEQPKNDMNPANMMYMA